MNTPDTRRAPRRQVAELGIGFTPVAAQSLPVHEAAPSAADLPLGTLLENEKARAVLAKVLGPMLESPMLAQMKSMSLKKLLSMGGQALPPEVYVRIRKTPEEYLISVRNRVQEDLLLEEGKLPGTTKKESGHGMGLANVQDVLRKYGAEYTVSCRDRWFRFTCAIPCAVHDMSTDNL